MGNWIKQQEEIKGWKEREKIRKEVFAKYFLNLSQLSFVGLVIGVIIPLYSNVLDIKNWYAVLTGSLLALVFALIGNKILK